MADTGFHDEEGESTMAFEVADPTFDSETSPCCSPARSLSERFRTVRAQTVALCASLSPEDHVVQSMPDASPAKWHLAHTTWFFETFVLAPSMAAHRPFRPEYNFLFNSYYNAI